jgi:hypothetical protein
MHGQFPRSLGETLLDKEQSHRWLKFGDIKRETECRVLAAQDQALSKNCFEKKFVKEETERKYRPCKEYEGTIDHLTSGYLLWQRMNTS